MFNVVLLFLICRKFEKNYTIDWCLGGEREDNGITSISKRCKPCSLCFSSPILIYVLISALNQCHVEVFGNLEPELDAAIEFYLNDSVESAEYVAF